MEKLKGFLIKQFEPLSSTYYAWRHFKNIAPNYQHRQWLTDRKTVIEAGMTLSTVAIVFSSYEPTVEKAEALRNAGACLFIPIIFGAAAIGKEMMKLGRQELSRQKRVASFRTNHPHRKYK